MLEETLDYPQTLALGWYHKSIVWHVQCLNPLGSAHLPEQSSLFLEHMGSTGGQHASIQLPRFSKSLQCCFVEQHGFVNGFWWMENQDKMRCNTKQL